MIGTVVGISIILLAAYFGYKEISKKLNWSKQ